MKNQTTATINQATTESSSTKTKSVNPAVQAALDAYWRKENERMKDFMIPILADTGEVGERARTVFKKYEDEFSYNVYPLFRPDPLTSENLPSVDFLVNLGEPNLFELRKNERHCLKSLNSRIRKLEKVLEASAEDRAGFQFDNRRCSHTALAPLGYAGEICQQCSVFQQHMKRLQHKVFHQMASGKTTYEDSFMAEMDVGIDQPCGDLCPLYAKAKNESVKNERDNLRSAMEAKIKELRQEKRLRIKYIDNLTKSIHDPRTLPNLPLFVDFRPRDHYKNYGIVAFLGRKINNKSFPKLYLGKTAGYAPSEHFNEPATYLDRHGNPLRQGAFYPDPEFLGAVLSKEADIDQLEHNLVPLGEFDQNLPFNMRFDELVELIKHPDYARIWAYTNLHTWNARENEVEPLLDELMQLANKIATN